MDMNGLTNVTETAAQNSYSTTTKASAKTDYSKTSYRNDDAVIYQKSNHTDTCNKTLVEKMKSDLQSRMDSMQSLVQQIFEKQGESFQTSDEMWKMLASGNFTVDAKTAQDAKDAISENGYWGVKQTSERIFDFAVSLSGGDEEKMNKMLDAFKKGFGLATKSWGKDLPELCKQTYDSVLEKFEQYQKEETTDSEK